MKIIPVILSGGFGTRLWPISRKHNPKQFLKLDGSTSLFKKALNLVEGDLFLPPIIVSNEAHKFFILDETQNFSALILEPCSKNTASSIALASIKAQELYKEETTLLVMPSDHLISEKILFLKSVQNALTTTKNITLFGVKPTHPATGYGYIETQGLEVKRFREKPNKETAEEFLEAGNFLWNSGIFMFTAENIIKSFTQFAPKILEICKASLSDASNEGNIITLKESKFKEAEEISFDCAILEKSTDISCVPMLSPWTDVGDLISYAENTSHPPKVEILKSVNTTVVSEKLVACIGLENITIVDTKDALLVAKNEHLQDVKKIVKKLEERGAEEVLHTSKVHKPWGHYEVLLDAQNYKVKRMFIKPECKLSLQSHEERSESWVFTQGTATVTINENEFLLNVGQATHIPLKAKHRLANNTQEPIIMIETQIGNYLGEDDITRYEDIYGRVPIAKN